MNRKEMKTGSFRIVPVICAEGTHRDTFPGCRGNRGMAAVTSSGEIVPCMQLSGTMQQRGESLGNVHTDRRIFDTNRSAVLFFCLLSVIAQAQSDTLPHSDTEYPLHPAFFRGRSRISR